MHTGIEAYSTVTSGIKEIIQSTDPHPKAATASPVRSSS
jgi:hypothetical protein